MTSKIVKSTSKGQITIPKIWRDQFSTENFLLEIDNKYILIKPIRIEDIEEEEILFDAERDNKGKGVSPDEMIKMLKKIQNE